MTMRANDSRSNATCWPLFFLRYMNSDKMRMVWPLAVPFVRGVLLVLLSCVVVGARGQGVAPLRGDGSEVAPYELTSVGHLLWLQAQVAQGALQGAYFIQTQDIDCRGVALQPIGASSHEFTGHYDGLAHQIANIAISNEHNQYVGLFGILGEGAMVQNLHLTVDRITGGEFVGGLAGQLMGGLLLNCSVRAAGPGAPGVTGDRHVGGAIGRLVNGRLVGIYTHVPVRLTDHARAADVGGMIGHAEQSDGALESSYTLGPVYAPADAEGVGGFIGRQAGGVAQSRFWDLYAAGAVINSSTGAIRPTGAFFGVVEGASLELRNCYYQSTHQGQPVTDGYLGGSYQVTPLDSTTFVSGEKIGGLNLGADYSFAKGYYPFFAAMWGRLSYRIEGDGQAFLTTSEGELVPDGSYWFIGTVLNLHVTPPSTGVLEEIKFGQTYLAPYYLPSHCVVRMGDNTLYAKFATATAAEGAYGQAVRVFPNPTRGYVHLEMPPIWREFALHGPTGQLVRQGDCLGVGTLVIDLTGLPPGLYTLRLQGAGAMPYVTKIVLQP